MNSVRRTQQSNELVKDRLDIQRAQSAVLVEVDGKEYALVADDNFSFNDPYWKAMFEAPNYVYAGPSSPPIAVGGSASAKKVNVGGKIGVVQDPFGNAKYLGATLPLDGYGIRNLSLSEDGKVMIGQLYGTFGTVDPGIQKPHQSQAWNVETLVRKAVENANTGKGLSNHIVLPSGTEQIIPTVGKGAPAGTFFDEKPLNISKAGNMGDVIGIDLTSLIRTLEGFATGALTDFNIIGTGLSTYAPSQNNASMHFLTKVDTGNTVPTRDQLYTREDSSSTATAVDSKLLFENTGIFFMAANLTQADMTTLRNGDRIEDGVKQARLTISFKLGGVDKQVTLTVSATDATHGAFFGDRPLNNPGYEKFGLIGEVNSNKPAGNKINDELDVARVEQRLAYLGYTAVSDDGKTISNIKVDGKLETAEKNALKLFEEIVRYQSVTATGTGSSNGVKVSIDYRATVTGSVSRLDLGPVPGSIKVLSKPDISDQFSEKQLISAINAASELARKDAMKKARNAAGFMDDPKDINGMDGLIEAGGAQRDTTIDWLNAYNAPHWLNFSGQLDVGKDHALDGWKKQTSTVIAQGTSWVRDLMLSAQFAAKAQGRQQLLFAGTGELGVKLNVGINTTYVSQTNQDRVDSNDIVLGRIPENAGNGQWNYNNAITSAQRLSNLSNQGTSSTNLNGSATPQANRQDQAMLDFLAVFAATQKDTTANNGSLDEQLSRITGATGDQQKIIQNALFGGGTQATGLINSSYVLLGGTANTVGDMLTAESLRVLMGQSLDGSSDRADYTEWVPALKAAMLEFDITTPNRITAFLAQVREETGGLTSLAERMIYMDPARANSFFGAFATDQQVIDYYKSIKELGQADDWYKSSNNWTLKQQKEFAEKVYGANSSKGADIGNTLVQDLANGVDGDGWNFRGHGLIQVTGKTNTTNAISYIASHPQQGQNTPTAAQILGDIDRYFTGDRYVAARSAAWFFSTHIDYIALDKLDVTTDGDPTFTITKTVKVTTQVGSATPTRTTLPSTSEVVAEYQTKKGTTEVSFSADGTIKTTTETTYKTIYTVGSSKYTDAVSSKVNPGGLSTFVERRTLWKERISPQVLNKNPYESMGSALARLGINTTNAAKHQSLFGVSLQVQKPWDMGRQALMTDAIQKTDSVNPSAETLDDQMQMLLNKANSILGAAMGDYPMVMIEPPSLPVDSPPVMLMSQGGASQQGATKGSHVMGVCQMVMHDEEGGGDKDIFGPIGMAEDYFRSKFPQKYKDKIVDITDATVQVLQPPLHGKLSFWDLSGTREGINYYERGGGVFYQPAHDYEGNDSLVLKVEGNLEGSYFSVEVHYFFRVFSYQGGVTEIDVTENPNCDGAGAWPISATLPQQPYTFGSDALTNYFLKDVSVSLHITNLINGAVGETIGNNITLDDDGAGHGWFIDSTPQDNSEFLPTSNPNEFIAKPGSEAAGKMDLLTVLLHEYGHALGLDHSADLHDFMAEELQPGVRRTVSDNDMATLWSLLGRVDNPVVHQSMNVDTSMVDIQDVHPTGNGNDLSAPFNPLPGEFSSVAAARHPSLEYSALARLRA